MNFNYKDSILYLQSPQILSDITISEEDSDVNFSQIVNPPTYNLKTDKKLRNKKKVKTKIYLNKALSHETDNFDLHEDSSTVKNYKLKGKKNFKNKIETKVSSLDQENKEQDNKQRNVYLNDSLTVKELAGKINISTVEIIKWLFLQGISITINQALDISISTLVAKHYEFNVLTNEPSYIKFSYQKKCLQGKLRAPVITLLGHVDHGKTSLLKALRCDNTLTEESGHITQAIGSYEFLLDSKQDVNKLIFLDTPGHESFVGMRQRGIDITDLVILVVSADDGLKPQTLEAISYIKERSLPFVVAINKIDKPEVNIENVKRQLSDHDIYKLTDQKYIIEVSALTGKNINLLLSALISLSILQELRSDPSQYAEGTILDARLDRQKGTVAKLLVQNGTLRVGDVIVTGNIYGKVKAMTNSLNEKVVSIESTSLAEVLCFASVPVVGLPFVSVKDEKVAKSISDQYVLESSSQNHSLLTSRISLDDMSKDGSKMLMKKLNIIVKTQMQGSTSAIVHALSKIPQEKVQINILSIASGEVSLQDIRLASTSSSMILAFDINVSPSVIQTAERVGVSIKGFKIIYDLVDYVRDSMLKLVDVEYDKLILGHAVVKSLFTINRGIIAGCFIIDGKLKKNSYFDLKRLNNIIYTGTIDSLKRIKEDVNEVLANNECGIACRSYNLWDIGDHLEIYDLIPLKKTL